MKIVIAIDSFKGNHSTNMAGAAARLESGIGLVIKETGLEEQVKDADIVITGEGRLDGQSYMGKVPVGVAKPTNEYNKTVMAF